MKIRYIVKCIIIQYNIHTYTYTYFTSMIPGGGFSKDFSKVKTILANEVIIAGPIGPAISIWLAQQGQIMFPCTARDH